MRFGDETRSVLDSNISNLRVVEPLAPADGPEVSQQFKLAEVAVNPD